jgi:peptidoglycan/xylan/chitin deacetylase (PgdA/CDA1 family)
MNLVAPNLGAHQIRSWTQVTDGTDSANWTIEAGTKATGEIVAHDNPASTRTYTKLTSGTNSVSGIRYDFSSVTVVGPFRAWVYLDPASLATGSDMIQSTIYLWNAGTNYYTYNAWLHQGWNCLQIGQVTAKGSNNTLKNQENAWSGTTGLPSFNATVRRWRIDVSAVPGKQTTLYLGPVQHSGYQRPKVVLTIDDGYERTVDEMLPALQDNGLRASLYAISALAGVSGFMTNADYDTWYAAGNDVCNHTRNHLTMSDNNLYSVAQITDEIASCEQWLVGRGYTRRNCHKHFASPLGAHARSEATNYRLALAGLGCLTACGIAARSGGQFPDCQFIPRHAYIPGVHSLAHYNNLLDAAIASGGSCITLVHDTKAVVDNSLQMATADWQAFCQRLGRENGVLYDVVPLSEWYQQTF